MSARRHDTRKPRTSWRFSIAFGAVPMDPEETTTPAEPITDPAPVLSEGLLLEAVDADGWRWKCQLIRAGQSLNGNVYPLPVLHEAASRYNGVPAYYGKGEDHNPRERGFDSVAGYFVDAAPNASGIEATLEVNRAKPAVREALRHAFDIKVRTGKETVGLSHVIPSGGAVLEAIRPRGYKVSAINRVSSVDIVMTPAAGGSLLAPLAESTYVPDALQEAIVTVEQMLAALREGKKIGPDDMARLAESVGGTELADAIEAGAKPATPAPIVEAKPVDTSALDRLNEAVAAAEQRMALAESRATLTTMLAESKLPKPMVDAIALDYDARVFEASDLTARIERDRGIAASLSHVRPHGLGAGIVPGEDQREKHQKAMDGLVWGQSVDGVKPFLTLKEAYMQITGDNRFSYIDGALPRAVMQEARTFTGDDPLLQESITTTTFGDVLGDSITRRMLQEYGRPDRQTWRPIVTTTPVVDFRTVERTRWGGYDFLPVVGQGGTYQPLDSPGDEKATDALDKRGGTEDLTLETIANDDMQVVRNIPRKLGYAAVDTLYNYIFNTVIAGNATASYDSVVLYHSGSHSNTSTTALGETGLLAVENAMRDQVGYGDQTALPLGAANMPRFLLIPNELRVTAHKLVMGPNAAVSAETATTPNMFQNKYQVIVVDSWTNAADWYAFADPSLSPVLEVGFYQGREEPELFVQDAANVGSMFTADKLTWKIRHIWYVMIVDHRGTYFMNV